MTIIIIKFEGRACKYICPRRNNKTGGHLDMAKKNKSVARYYNTERGSGIFKRPKNKYLPQRFRHVTQQTENKLFTY